MNMSSHLQELEKKHQILEASIKDALKSPGSDGLDISDMKRRKLRLKDEIKRCSHEQV